mmetsp:Transcript_36888/g.82995  ORF Transcript_36888/g.82995 Transcript_36888/m.82995 type:complete len:201 (+) Transcript_36888:1248-1850(+)
MQLHHYPAFSLANRNADVWRQALAVCSNCVCCPIILTSPRDRLTIGYHLFVKYFTFVKGSPAIARIKPRTTARGEKHVMIILLISLFDLWLEANDVNFVLVCNIHIHCHHIEVEVSTNEGVGNIFATSDFFFSSCDFHVWHEEVHMLVLAEVRVFSWRSEQICCELSPAPSVETKVVRISERPYHEYRSVLNVVVKRLVA